jgi:hypothetical protein
LILATLMPHGAQPRAACPVDSVDVCGTTTLTSAPSFQTSGCAFNGSVAIYNLVLGKLDAGAPNNLSIVTVRTEDLYTLAGPASGGPIAFRAVFSVHGSTGGLATCKSQIRCGGRVQELDFLSGCGLSCSFSAADTLPLTYPVGEPFPLDLYVNGDCTNVNLRGFENHATISGTLSFTLPAGYTITSCQGFSTAPTVARSLGWGGLKVLYR